MVKLRLRSASALPRIVVTGVGVVSGRGTTATTFWDSLTSRRHPVDSADDTADLQDHVPFGVADFSGRIDDFCELPTATRKAIQKSLKLMNRETQMGVAAGQRALHDRSIARWALRLSIIRS
jgi:3-oxoacyl-[acyl-carrier-protein] synthase II